MGSMSRMNLALVSEHANPLATVGGVDAGGQNVHVAALAANLVARGHEVTVFTRRDHPSTPARVVAEGGYVVEHVTSGPPSEVPKDDLLAYMPRFADRLRDRFTEERFDVVHAHFWMSGVASLAAGRSTGVPVVQTFHALGSVKRRQQGARDTSPPTRIEHERLLCRSVDHVVATCTDELAELRLLGLPAGRASVIPCGVDTELFRPVPAVGGSGAVPSQRQDDRPRLLVIGRLVERKGVGNVIEALAALPGVELVVAGGPATDLLDADPEVDRLRRVAERLGVSDRVRFTGAVSRAEVPALMAAADIVVAVPWYEPFGIVPLEAMACGRPIVGSAVGGLLDSVVPGVTGELVAPRRPDHLSAVLRTLLADPARRVDYGRAGRRRAVSAYQWQHVAEATEGVYAAVVREAAARRPSLRQHLGVSR